ncbi:MAG TPA: hypothetical protein VF691_06765 [Cytophagaceae bacterium]|jgi:hypothetical protein
MVIGLFQSSNLINLSELRTRYKKAVEDEDEADALFKIVSSNESDAVFLAYKAGLESIKAKHAFNPAKKISHVSTSMKTFEKAVAKDPENIEIRYLRFVIQYHVPSFMGYSKNLDEDKSVIVKNFDKAEQYKIDLKYLQEIAGFMIYSKKLTEAETIKIKALAKL